MPETVIHRPAVGRRQVLALAARGLLLSSAASLASPLIAAPRARARPVALLLPMTGPRAALGLSMSQAAMLAENDGGSTAQIKVYDTGGSAAGAANAARAAAKARAPLILGPLTAEEMRAAAGAVGGGVPIVAFSNDAGSRGGGAFVFGVTPAQSTSAVLRYARTRGVKSVLVVGDGGAWSTAAADAARALEGELGMAVRIVTVAAGGALPVAGEPTDAVLVPGDSASLIAAARALKDSGVQMLATVQGLDHRPEALGALDGAWIATPDPEAFGTFAQAFEARNGSRPGLVAAIAHDAARIARQLRTANMLTREGLLAEAGFDCATGHVRFRTDGSVAREFAIVVAEPGGYRKVAESQGA